MTTPCVVPRCTDGTGPREAGHDRWACPACVARSRKRLRETEIYYGMLPSLLRPVRGEDTRRSPGYGSRSPGRLDVIVARDIRSRTDGHAADDEQHPMLSVLGTLHRLARALRQEQDVSPPRGAPTVASEVGYLLGAVEWCAHQRWVAVPFHTIAALHVQCRRLALEQPPGSIGRCPTLLPTGECRTPLYVPTTGDSVVCHNPACRREWKRPEWERLAALITSGP